ncbi:hypothetical protein QDY72_04245 [Kingella negevensis]|uniref:glycosyltransferase family protein n=1 Tax=Kingella negevensis TaxID=1522312 RepID=UPI002550841A|nr:hypothetical protein [Kingella negevensis]MDK4684395.1 hypothetical protein [Kingella negevensis]
MTVLNTNICILERANVPIFNDMANLLHHALLDSNCHSQISQIRDYLLYSCMVQGAINIILTPHYLLPSNLAHLQPETTIIINSEPLLAFEKSNSPMHQHWLENIMRAAKHCHLWNYSQENLQFFERHGITHGQYLQLGFHEKLSRIKHVAEPDIDVLFYGAITPRRAEILNQLQREQLRVVTLGNFWGEELDSWIARSKIVLNMHAHDDSPFETVRCFYLINNSVAVVAEETEQQSLPEHYKESVRAVPYNELVKTCAELCSQPENWRAQREQALCNIQRYPQTQIIQQLLYNTFCAAA